MGNLFGRKIRSRNSLSNYCQMGDFRFFHGLNLAHTVYSLSDNLSKALQKDKLSAVDEASVAMKTVQTFKNMRNEQSADLFFKKVSKKASSFDFIQKPILPRKRRNPNYKTMNDYFRVDGRLEDKTTEAYHPTTAKERYRGL